MRNSDFGLDVITLRARDHYRRYWTAHCTILRHLTEYDTLAFKIVLILRSSVSLASTSLLDHCLTLKGVSQWKLVEQSRGSLLD